MEMKRSKVTVLVLSVCMIMASFSVIPVRAADTEPDSTAVAQIGEAKYEKLTDAVSKADVGAEVDVLADIDQAGTITVTGGQELTLDLNGHTVSGASFNVKGSLTVIDSTVGQPTVAEDFEVTYDGAGKITGGGIVVSVKPEGGSDACFCLKSGIIEGTGTTSVVQVSKPSDSEYGTVEIDIQGGYIYSLKNGALAVDGDVSYESQVHISGGVLKSDCTTTSVGIYAIDVDNATDRLWVDGGTIIGRSKEAVHSNCTETIISGGTFYSRAYTVYRQDGDVLQLTGGKFICGADGKESYSAQDNVIQIGSNADEIVISGNPVVQGCSPDQPTFRDVRNNVRSIAGGTFSRKPDSGYIVESYAAYAAPDGWYRVVKEFDKENDQDSTFWLSGSYDIRDYKDGNTYPELQDYLFAGWFTDEECTTPIGQDIQEGIVYAKFVDRSMLTVKGQIKNGTTAESGETNLRMLSSVDSLGYSQVGFVIQKGPGAEKKEFVTDKVYQNITGEELGTAVSYDPTVFSKNSQWFITYTITEIPTSAFDTEITIQPFWVTLDGTKVYGEERTLTVQEGINASTD